MPVVRARDLSFAYPEGPAVLEGVDLDVQAGEFVGIAGPNGGGKTTLIRLVVGLEQPTGGELEVFGGPPPQATGANRIGYLPQRAEIGLSAPITVREVVESGRVSVAGIFGALSTEDEAAVDEAIERVGLSEKAGERLTRLSGGQRQRAFIAKALAGGPKLLVLDEPTTGVDADAQERLAELLDELRAQLGVTILYVSHEFGAIEPYAERLVVVRSGIVFDGAPSALPDVWHDPSHVHP
ncbi:MAG: metal ABC transporter ATP-binding protein [Solirubrobacterales bacterium]|nr:metal ABC transporter ATP-binding protein [Solirubrobacterales bacterium]